MYRFLFASILAMSVSVPAFAELVLQDEFGQEEVSSPSIQKTLDFGSVYVNDTRHAGLRLTNRGEKSITGIRVHISGGSEFRASTTCRNLEPNDSCQIRVEFRPRRPGSHHGSLSIRSNEGGSMNISLRGYARER